MIFLFLFNIYSIINNFLFLILHVISPNSFPNPLSTEDEEKYINLAKNGDSNAKNILIEHNLRLVAHITKKYQSSKYDSDDLISIGTIGLIKAVNTFDNSKGIRLSSYASRCIENSILTQWIHKKIYGTLFLKLMII